MPVLCLPLACEGSGTSKEVFGQRILPVSLDQVLEFGDHGLCLIVVDLSLADQVSQQTAFGDSKDLAEVGCAEFVETGRDTSAEAVADPGPHKAYGQGIGPILVDQRIDFVA